MSDDSQFDFSKWDFPEDRIWLHIPESEMIIKICTFVPVLIFGLIGNYIIVRLIVKNRALRTPTNLIIANMAVADLLTLLICPSMFLINDFYQNYLLGSVGCKLEGFLEGAFLITAVLNLSAVSYDRLTAIVLPSEARLTMRGAKIVIFFTWLAGILIALPLAIYRTYKFQVRHWKNFTEMYCKENPNILPKYWYVLITVMVWLPLAIMLICYTAIFYKLDRYEKRVLNREHPLTVSYKKTVARTLFIITIVFVVLRLPFTILVIMRDRIIANTESMIKSSFRIFWYISQYLMFLNAAINPVIYGYTNDNFRRAYEQLPLCKSCCSPKTKLPKPKHTLWKSVNMWLRKNLCCFKTTNDFTGSLRNQNLNVGFINDTIEADKVVQNKPKGSGNSTIEEHI
ncbi:neuropeptide FF receptor 2 [Musca vetustissima]|uniref:neuropeptide FF receptor 2 n=1 Tax=Musca vetustissima TaxID=27455 RepID=UPI002AB696D7|nr:neuropeptide FF receptor 2 [Musca vetustissima]